MAAGIAGFGWNAQAAALGVFGGFGLLIGMAGVGGAAFVARERLLPVRTDAGGAPLRVVGQARLSGQSGLALVEVRDLDGRVRRLVVGMGGGSPHLVSDLGAQISLSDADDGIDVDTWMADDPHPSPMPSFAPDVRLAKADHMSQLGSEQRVEEETGRVPDRPDFSERIASALASRRQVMAPEVRVDDSLSNDVPFPRFERAPDPAPERSPGLGGLGRLGTSKSDRAMDVRAELERRLAPARSAARRGRTPETSGASLGAKRTVEEARSLVEQMLAERA